MEVRASLNTEHTQQIFSLVNFGFHCTTNPIFFLPVFLDKQLFFLVVTHFALASLQRAPTTSRLYTREKKTVVYIFFVAIKLHAVQIDICRTVAMLRLFASLKVVKLCNCCSPRTVPPTWPSRAVDRLSRCALRRCQTRQIVRHTSQEDNDYGSRDGCSDDDRGDDSCFVNRLIMAVASSAPYCSHLSTHTSLPLHCTRLGAIYKYTSLYIYRFSFVHISCLSVIVRWKQ